MQASDVQQIILENCAAALPCGPTWDAETTQLMTALQAQMPLLWQMYNGYATTPFRQMKYVQLAAVNVLLGQMRTKRDGTLGGVLVVKGSILFKNLIDLRTNTLAEIKEIELRSRANQQPCIGQIPYLPPPIRVPGAPQPTATTTFASVNGTTVATTVINVAPGLDPASPELTGDDPRVRTPEVRR